MRSDAELLAAARSDAGAFRELYDRYAARVYGYHLRRSRDAHAAHDLTAETFAQAWLARTRFRDEARGSAGPWLFGIARHVLLASVRQRQLERSACERLGVLDATDRREPPAPEDGWLDGLDEAAEQLATSPQAVRARVSRGLSALRKHFSDSVEMSR